MFVNSCLTTRFNELVLANSWGTLQDPLGLALEFFFKIEMEDPLVSTLGNISKIKNRVTFF